MTNKNVIDVTENCEKCVDFKSTFKKLRLKLIFFPPLVVEYKN